MGKNESSQQDKPMRRNDHSGKERLRGHDRGPRSEVGQEGYCRGTWSAHHTATTCKSTRVTVACVVTVTITSLSPREQGCGQSTTSRVAMKNRAQEEIDNEMISPCHTPPGRLGLCGDGGICTVSPVL